MFLACILLTIAMASGTPLTFIYERNMPLAARLCAGSCTGLALLASISFLFASFSGLTARSIGLSSLVLLLPWLLLLQSGFRELVQAEVGAAVRSVSRAFHYPDLGTIGYFGLYLGWALLFSAVFAQGAFERSGGIYTGTANNLGDLPFHLQVISSFAYGNNFPPQDPIYAGVRFTYPLLADFLTAIFVRMDAGILRAMWLQNVVLSLALVGLLHQWTLRLTRSSLAGVLAPLLVVFSGGLGWCWIFQDLRNSDHGLLPLLGNLPHDYTILNDSIFRWGNSLTTLLLPQRSLLLGLPLAICIFYLWWISVSVDVSSEAAPPTSSTVVPKKAQSRKDFEDRGQSASMRRMIAAGLWTGLLPLIHTHTFIVVLATAACLALLFRSCWREWLAFFAVALIVALPELVWLLRDSGIHARSFLGWQTGWDHGSHDPLWFWFVNTGFFVPLLLAAVFWRQREDGPSPRLVLFYAPFLLWFILPNLIKLAPWIWDNIKVLFYWYVASVPLVALLLASWCKRKRYYRWIAASLLVSLIASGALDVLRLITHAAEYQEFSSAGTGIARMILGQAPPQAVILHAPTYNSPVFLTGRRSLLGYPGWLWSRGLDYSQREADIKAMYSGGPAAEALLKHYGVDYVLVGPEERSSLVVNDQFWKRYTQIAEAGDYRLYRIGAEK